MEAAKQVYYYKNSSLVRITIMLACGLEETTRAVTRYLDTLMLDTLYYGKAQASTCSLGVQLKSYEK